MTDDVAPPDLDESGPLEALIDNIHPPNWRNPVPRSPYHLVVIGAGPAGVTAAREAAELGARVALIESAQIGGVRLNAGCVSSKAVIRSARFYAEMRAAEDCGWQSVGNADAHFPAMMARMQRIRARLSRIASAQRLREAGVDVYFGAARFRGGDLVAVADATLQFGKAIIATGTRPLIPAIPGLAAAGYLTNETVFALRECPRRLLVLGGGPLGCEMAQAYCRIGAQVFIVQEEPMFLPREERDAAQILSDALAKDGVAIHPNTNAVAVRTDGDSKIVDLQCDGDRFSVTVDAILVGVGRAPNIENLRLDTVMVDATADVGITVDDLLRTSNPHIYAAGDVCMADKYTHAAEASARIAVANALFLGRQRVSALAIPCCTYTDPEIAHVGLYLRDMWDRSIPVKTFTVLMHDVDRAVTDGEDEGFVKIHVREGTDRILGASVVASRAGEMINELSLAISAGVGLRQLARVIHTYPTQAQAIKMAADAYNRTRLTPRRKAVIASWLDR
jgi:pyruvate/2-oxoglutarate dehydrogenase complex dihydrolipoamide dehydrogenase (E3) component